MVEASRRRWPLGRPPYRSALHSSLVSSPALLQSNAKLSSRKAQNTLDFPEYSLGAWPEAFKTGSTQK